MKIKPEHFAMLSSAIDAQADRFKGAALAYLSAGMSEQRFIWDVLRATGLRPGNAHNGDAWSVYDYMNDSHIETALKAALKKSGLVY